VHPELDVLRPLLYRTLKLFRSFDDRDASALCAGVAIVLAVVLAHRSETAHVDLQRGSRLHDSSACSPWQCVTE
jgi:hypothetical protein